MDAYCSCRRQRRQARLISSNARNPQSDWQAGWHQRDLVLQHAQKRMYMVPQHTGEQGCMCATPTWRHKHYARMSKGCGRMQRREGKAEAWYLQWGFKIALGFEPAKDRGRGFKIGVLHAPHSPVHAPPLTRMQPPGCAQVDTTRLPA